METPSGTVYLTSGPLWTTASPGFNAAVLLDAAAGTVDAATASGFPAAFPLKPSRAKQDTDSKAAAATSAAFCQLFKISSISKSPSGIETYITPILTIHSTFYYEFNNKTKFFHEIFHKLCIFSLINPEWSTLNCTIQQEIFCMGCSSLIVKYYMPRALFKDWFLGININRAIINYVTQMKVMNPGLRERGLLPERIKYEESV